MPFSACLAQAVCLYAAADVTCVTPSHSLRWHEALCQRKVALTCRLAFGPGLCTQNELTVSCAVQCMTARILLCKLTTGSITLLIPVGM